MVIFTCYDVLFTGEHKLVGKVSRVKTVAGDGLPFRSVNFNGL
jgi:hypothetical protein